MDYLISFLIGGVICALVQILLDRTKLMPGRVMVCLVCGGVILGFAGLYQPFQDFAKAGASVPLLGFGNVLWKGVKEAVDKNGFIGIFMGMDFWDCFREVLKQVPWGYRPQWSLDIWLR